MLQTKVAEKIKTSILCAIMFFQKSCDFRICEKIWKSQTGHK
jgi:hypothetical protein